MKTTLRIVTLSLVLGLAGAVVTAWGAESVMDLISQGEAAMAKVKSSKTALDELTQKNTALVAEGNEIRTTQTQLQADIAAYSKVNGDIAAKTAAYKAKCNNKQLTPDEYKACAAQLSEINASIASANTEPAKLKARQQAFIARATAFNQQAQELPNQVKAADATYRTALSYEYAWLDRARDQVATPAFQPYAKKYKCPNVMKPAKTQEEADTMSEQILACLKRVVNSN